MTAPEQHPASNSEARKRTVSHVEEPDHPVYVNGPTSKPAPTSANAGSSGLREELMDVLASCRIKDDAPIQLLPDEGDRFHVASMVIASDWLAKVRAEAKVEAVRMVREWADDRGVNVGDEDSDWWRGYRQAQREAVHEAAGLADLIEAGEQP